MNFSRLACFIILIGSAKCQQDCRHDEPQLEIAKTDVEVRNGTIFYENHAFKPGDYEAVGDYYYICPCNVKYCVRTCTNLENYFPPNKSFKLDVVTKDGHKKNVDFYSHFYPIDEIRDSHDCFWDVITDAYDVLENGSVAFLFGEEVNVLYKSSDFCFAEDSEGESKKLACFIEDPDFVNIKLSHSYLPLYVVSAIFLLITALAIVASKKEGKSNLSKLAVCFALTMMVSYSLFTIFYYLKPPNLILNDWICSIFAYTIYVSRLSPYFWLYSMCFENFQLNSKQARREPQISRSFAFSALCSIMIPALIFVIYRVANRIWHHSRGEFDYSISEETCNFQDYDIEMIVYNGPAAIVSIINLILLVSTLKLGQAQDRRSWFFISVLLFIITVFPIILDCGVFWLMDVKNDESFVWTILYILNSISGIFVFLVFAIFNGNFRKSLFCSKNVDEHYNEVELR
ncbi:probable G-protein coupled receptor Mth-like 10 [Neocloeon triangulifer]|uniref:probable G-protein coupled receptor Mth-like 10 n=1 Tax=Neocloeon triangulifer TaxID=2078957 RepID=UPI00286EE098|nr:probable G-protein coupled receptor Mth-like 10 [Neocloeon triangulifer]